RKYDRTWSTLPGTIARTHRTGTIIEISSDRSTAHVPHAKIEITPHLDARNSNSTDNTIGHGQHCLELLPELTARAQSLKYQAIDPRHTCHMLKSKLLPI